MDYVDAFLEVRRRVRNLVTSKKTNAIEIEWQNIKNYEKKKVLEFECQLHLGWKQLVFNLIFF